MKKEEEMIRLIKLLKDRNNPSYKFFEELLAELKDECRRSEGLAKLLPCYAITQYAGFTSAEEKLLSEIIIANSPK